MKFSPLLTLVFFHFILSRPLLAQKSGENIFDNSFVHEIKFEFDESNYDRILLENFENNPVEEGNPVPYLQASVLIDEIVVDSIGIRYKGFTSYMGEGNKNPIKIDFNEFVAGKRFDGLKKLNLNNATNDPAMLRDPIAYKLLRSMGVKAPRTSFANVYFNNELIGLYQVIEQIDKTFVTDNFPNGSGNLYKNKGWSKLEMLGSEKSDYNTTFELKTNRSEDDWTGFIDFVDFLNNSSDVKFEEEIESIFDVDLFLKTLAVDVSLNNWDSYLEHGRNYYLYEDKLTGVFHWLPWDYNFSLGSSLILGGEEYCTLFPDFLSWTDSTTTVQFFDSSFYFGEATHEYDFGDGNKSSEKDPVHTYSESGTYQVCLTVKISDDCEENICKLIDSNTSFNSCPSLENNTQVEELDRNFIELVNFMPECCDSWTDDCSYFYNLISEFNMSDDTLGGGIINFSFGINQDENEGILIKRLMNVPSIKERYYDNFCNLTQTHFTSEIYDAYIDSEVQLIDASIQNDPLYPNSYMDFLEDAGENGLKKLIANRIDTLKRELELTYTCTEKSSPIDYGDLVINELVASTDSTTLIVDDEGENEDWIELYNRTSSDIDLSDIYLSDSKTDFKKWKFPSESNIPAKSYLIVWADKDEDQSGIHSNFKLNKAGDELTLSNEDGTIIDSISFGQRTTNVAYARIPNGTGPFIDKAPTFGYNNEHSSSTFQEEQVLAFQLYPNPTSTILNIKVKGSEQYSAEILNATGLNMITTAFFEEFYTLDISALTSGIYITKLIDRNGHFATLKFMKN